MGGLAFIDDVVVLSGTCHKVHDGSESHRTLFTSVTFYRTTTILGAMSDRTASLSLTGLSAYAKFNAALRSKEVRRQYPHLLERFLDFCKFEGLSLEDKVQSFYEFAETNSQELI